MLQIIPLLRGHLGQHGDKAELEVGSAVPDDISEERNDLFLSGAGAEHFADAGPQPGFFDVVSPANIQERPFTGNPAARTDRRDILRCDMKRLREFSLCDTEGADQKLNPLVDRFDGLHLLSVTENTTGETQLSRMK